jgi:hypothetical protein
MLENRIARVLLRFQELNRIQTHSDGETLPPATPSLPSLSLQIVLFIVALLIPLLLGVAGVPFIKGH